MYFYLIIKYANMFNNANIFCAFYYKSGKLNTYHLSLLFQTLCHRLEDCQFKKKWLYIHLICFGHSNVLIAY